MCHIGYNCLYLRLICNLKVINISPIYTHMALYNNIYRLADNRRPIHWLTILRPGALGSRFNWRHHSLGQKQSWERGRRLNSCAVKLLNAEKNSTKISADTEKQMRNISSSCRITLQNPTKVFVSSSPSELRFRLLSTAITNKKKKKRKKRNTKLVFSKNLI